ncbi:MAG: AzlC family ABC transporter permease [Termitinemataceae bacterium]|nr:MAG: AzlC family ABC transporter permease [Termitinemataceae bacterium]
MNFQKSAKIGHRNINQLFAAAFKYSIPVLLGYLAIGMAFGLMIVDAGYPWYLGVFMSIVMYAGAGQYAAVGLLASGVGLLQACVVQLVLNARHIAYGITMLNRYNASGKYKTYLIFAMTDETFALLSSVDKNDTKYGTTDVQRGLFFFYVSLLDHIYWIAGSLLGAFVGTVVPLNYEGVGFALCALFIVLMIEQLKKSNTNGVRKAMIISVLVSTLSVIFIPSRFSLLCALSISLSVVQIICGKSMQVKGSNNE